MSEPVAQIFHGFNLMLLGAGAFLALRLILTRPHKAKYPDWILLALLVAALIPAWNLYAAQFSPYPSLLVLGWPLSLSYWLPAPLLFVYVKATLSRSVRPVRHWIHLTPFAAAAAFTLLMPGKSLGEFRFVVVGWIAVTTAYLVATVRLLIRVRRDHEHNYSQQLKPVYRWFLLLIAGWALFLFWDIYMSARLLIPVETSDIDLQILTLLQAGYLLIIILFSHWHPLEPVLKFDDRPAPPAPPKALRLDGETARELAKIIEETMRTRQLFLQPDISLRTMAQAISITTHELSEVLNTHINSSFYDYINSKRIAFAKKRIAESPGTSITDIAYECGYNSKSVFYGAFKKQCGVTPSQYRSSLIQPGT